MTKAQYPQQRRRAPRDNELHGAVNAGSTEYVSAVLASGSVDIDQCDSMAIFFLLFFFFSDFLVRHKRSGHPLIIATIEDHAGIVRILLDEGADTSVAGHDGVTALIVAAQLGHLGVAKMLIEAGACLELATSGHGRTALIEAAREGHLEVNKALIGAGANPDSRTHDGITRLYWACFEGHPGVVRVLLCGKAITPCWPGVAHFSPFHWTWRREKDIRKWYASSSDRSKSQAAAVQAAA